jgi:hypothetical protein
MRFLRSPPSGVATLCFDHRPRENPRPSPHPALTATPPSPSGKEARTAKVAVRASPSRYMIIDRYSEDMWTRRQKLRRRQSKLWG